MQITKQRSCWSKNKQTCLMQYVMVNLSLGWSFNWVFIVQSFYPSQPGQFYLGDAQGKQLRVLHPVNQYSYIRAKYTRYCIPSTDYLSHTRQTYTSHNNYTSSPWWKWWTLTCKWLLRRSRSVREWLYLRRLPSCMPSLGIRRLSARNSSWRISFIFSAATEMYMRSRHINVDTPQVHVIHSRIRLWTVCKKQQLYSAKNKKLNKAITKKQSCDKIFEPKSSLSLSLSHTHTHTQSRTFIEMLLPWNTRFTLACFSKPSFWEKKMNWYPMPRGTVLCTKTVQTHRDIHGWHST